MNRGGWTEIKHYFSIQLLFICYIIVCYKENIWANLDPCTSQMAESAYSNTVENKLQKHHLCKLVRDM